jgi:hypothetical protein
MDDLTMTAMTVDAGRHPFEVAFGVVAQSECLRDIFSSDSVSTSVNDLTPVVGGGTALRLGGLVHVSGSAHLSGTGTAMTMLLPPTAHAPKAAASTRAASKSATSMSQTQQVRAQAVPAPSITVNLGGYARGIPPRGMPV